MDESFSWDVPLFRLIKALGVLNDVVSVQKAVRKSRDGAARLVNAMDGHEYKPLLLCECE